jgi:diguanylate cyclase (GGDEF)-like protein/PAS domain S-box-containing protein
VQGRQTHLRGGKLRLLPDGDVLGELHDITERKLADLKIKKSMSLLQATLESTADAMLVVDLNNTWRLHNQQFIDLWKIPEEIVAANDDKSALSFVLDQLEDAESFLNKVRELYATPHARSFDTIQFKDGRVLERFSIPQLIDGEVVGRVWSFRDVSARKEMELQVAQLAFFDTLTDLPNRRMLNDRLGLAVASSKRNGSYSALLFLDLDNFKPLNDRHGHAVGDELLIEVARRLKVCVRETDTVARFGGDEFAIVLNVLDRDKAESILQARNVAEKIRCSVSQSYHLTVKCSGAADEEIVHHCTSSIGVVMFINHEGDLDELMKRADSAMYQAKGAGRNATRFYDAGAVSHCSA